MNMIPCQLNTVVIGGYLWTHTISEDGFVSYECEALDDVDTYCHFTTGPSRRSHFSCFIGGKKQRPASTR